MAVHLNNILGEYRSLIDNGTFEDVCSMILGFPNRFCLDKEVQSQIAHYIHQQIIRGKMPFCYEWRQASRLYIVEDTSNEEDIADVHRGSVILSNRSVYFLQFDQLSQVMALVRWLDSDGALRWSSDAMFRETAYAIREFTALIRYEPSMMNDEHQRIWQRIVDYPQVREVDLTEESCALWSQHGRTHTIFRPRNANALGLDLIVSRGEGIRKLLAHDRSIQERSSRPRCHACGWFLTLEWIVAWDTWHTPDEIKQCPSCSTKIELDDA